MSSSGYKQKTIWYPKKFFILFFNPPGAVMQSSASDNQTAKLEEKAYAILKDKLLSGAYYPGARLVERDLAEQLDMSRTPVRWALRQLENEGYLERLGNRGFCVRMPDREEALNILDIRAAIEGMAAFLAASRRTEQHVAAFDEIIAAMRETAENHDLLTYYRLTADLHQLIFTASANPELAAFAIRINAQSSRFHFRTLLLPERLGKSVAEHAEMAEHIKNRDADKAERCTRNHVLAVKTLIAEHDDLMPDQAKFPII